MWCNDSYNEVCTRHWDKIEGRSESRKSIMWIVYEIDLKDESGGECFLEGKNCNNHKREK